MRKRTYNILVFMAVAVVFSTVIVVYNSFFQSVPEKSSEQIISEDHYTHNSNKRSDTQAEETDTSSFEIHFFNVGEADSALVMCDGCYMLIDGGNSGNSSFIYSYLESHGIDYLDYIVCSHAHADHVGGLAGALNFARVGVAYSPVVEYDSRAFNSFVKYLSLQGKSITVPSSGETITLGTASITFIGPIDISLAKIDENNSSIVLRIEYGKTSFLFTGDAETAEESSLVNSDFKLKSTLLKVGHHGSNSSSSQEFIDAVDPQYAVISVGINDLNHPNDAVVERLKKHCDKIYRTDLNGDIVCSSDGNTLTFYAEADTDY